MDGIAVTVKVKVSPDPDYAVNTNFYVALENMTIETDGEGCQIDRDQMKYDPVRIRFYHLDKTSSLRKLLWHESEHRSDVSHVQ